MLTMSSQQGTNTMDGPSGVNQCAIPPGDSFTYNFTVRAIQVFITIPLGTAIAMFHYITNRNTD